MSSWSDLIATEGEFPVPEFKDFEEYDDDFTISKEASAEHESTREILSKTQTEIKPVTVGLTHHSLPIEAKISQNSNPCPHSNIPILPVNFISRPVDSSISVEPLLPSSSNQFPPYPHPPVYSTPVVAYQPLSYPVNPTVYPNIYSSFRHDTLPPPPYPAPLVMQSAGTKEQFEPVVTSPPSSNASQKYGDEIFIKSETPIEFTAVEDPVGCGVIVEYSLDPTEPRYDNENAFKDLCGMLNYDPDAFTSDDGSVDDSSVGEGSVHSDMSTITTGTSGTATNFIVPKTESRISGVMEAIESGRMRRRSIGSASTVTADNDDDSLQEQVQIDATVWNSSQSVCEVSGNSKKLRKSENLHPLVVAASDLAEPVIHSEGEVHASELPLTDFRRHFMGHIAKCTNHADPEGLERFIRLYFADDVVYMHRYKGKKNPYGATRMTVEGIDAVTKVWLGFQIAIPDGFVHILENKVILMQSGNSQIHAKYTFSGTKTLDVISDSAKTVVMASSNDGKGTMIVATSDEQYSQESTSISTHSTILQGVKKQIVSIHVLSAITYYINRDNRVNRIENVLTVITDQISSNQRC